MAKRARTFKLRPVAKRLGGYTAGLALVGLVMSFGYITWAKYQIDRRIQQLRNARPTYIYAPFTRLHREQLFGPNQFVALLRDAGFSQVMNQGDFLPATFQIKRQGSSQTIDIFRPEFIEPGTDLKKERFRIETEDAQPNIRISSLVSLDHPESEITSIELPPKRVGAFFAGRIRTQRAVLLSEMPVSVRYAVMAIEDIHFLSHKGVSLRSTVRALWKDLRAGRWVEGGSTITQQLMKNLFLTRQKAIARKIKEAIFAFIAESNHSKEDILEAYLNEVYLGQWGTREIHGVAEGASYYFNQNIENLNLAQSATLAAIIQTPNAHDPYRRAERVIQRRNLVLKRMLAAEFIEQSEYDSASQEPIGVVPIERNLPQTDYFFDLLLTQLPANVVSRMEIEPYTIYITLDPFLQASASQLLNEHISRMTSHYKDLKDRAKSGLQLQGATLWVDVPSCQVRALQGGHSYRQTQFNRILMAKRQAGSLFKPFVALAALADMNVAKRFNPVTEIDDSPFDWAYEGNQLWTPKNYDHEFRGKVTLRQAIENSLNVPMAKVAEEIGIQTVHDTLAKAGISSKMLIVPSLSLGSADVRPFEVAESYLTLSRIGHRCTPTSWRAIYDSQGNETLNPPPESEPAISPAATFVTVEMMKGIFERGTAKWLTKSNLPLKNFAGKTGTTNDNHDAWFVGFSPDLLGLVWIGYDDTVPLGYTGSVAALPLWASVIKESLPLIQPNHDFVMPEGVTTYEVDPSTHGEATMRCPERYREFFVSGTRPNFICPKH